MNDARHPRLYWTADRRALVEEGDPRGALLAYPPDDPVPPEHLELISRRSPAAVPAQPGDAAAAARKPAAKQPGTPRTPKRKGA